MLDATIKNARINVPNNVLRKPAKKVSKESGVKWVLPVVTVRPDHLVLLETLDRRGNLVLLDSKAVKVTKE